MLQNTLELIAKEVANKGQYIHVKDNSVFEAINSIASDVDDRTVSFNMATKINNELILIKNKLRPLMNEIAASIETKLGETKIESNLSKYKINTVTYPSVIDELIELKEVQTVRTPNDIGTSSVIINVPNVEDVRKMFTHFNSSVNIYISNIVSKKSDSDLIALWEKYLSPISNTNPNINSMGFGVVDRVEDLLLLHTLLRNLLSNTEADNKRTEMLNLLLNEVNNYLAIVKENILNNRSTGQLIVSVKDNTAIVDDVLYKQFIEEGNTPEVIIGYILKGDNQLASSLYTNIVKDKQEYLDIYNSKVKMETYQEANNNIKRYKLVYDIVFEDVFNNQIPEDLKEHQCSDYITCKAKLDEIVNNYQPDELTDYNLVARDMVGKVLFPNTNFLHFAKAITSYTKLNDKLTPQDAATIASLDFILDFLLEQVYVGDMNGQPINK